MGSDKRAYTRHEVRWDAEIHAPTGSGLAMEIRDFCEGGVFLIASSRTAAASLKQLVAPEATVNMHVRDPLTGRDLRVRARAAHVSATGLGLSFYQPAPSIVAGLMAVNAGQVAASGAASTEDNPPLDSRQRQYFQRVLRECYPLVEDYAGRSLDTFIVQAEARLMNGSNDATSTAEQSALYNARKRLQSRAGEVREAFMADLGTAWQELGAFRVPGEGGEGDKDKLALVDEGDFEDWLARSELITRAESRSQQRLRLLHRRLSRATGTAVDDQRNPVSPAALCYILSRRLDALKLTVQGRKLVYQAFGKTFLQQSGVLYDSLNGRLREHGILPDLEGERYTITNVRSQDNTPSREADPEGPGASSATTAVGMSSVMASVRSLFRRQRGDRTPAASDGTAPPQEAVVRAAAAIDAPSTAGPGLRQQVEGRLREAGYPALDATTAESVDLLETWMAGVQRTDGHDQLQQWVNRLAPAALRLELNDGSFLSRRDHGLHRLIDHLDRAANIIGALDDTQAAAMRASVEEVLASVNREADEPDALVDACASLARLTDSPQRRVSANVERLRERYEGSERLQEARTAVAGHLDRLFGQRPVPEPLQRLLDEGWQHHLVLTYLRHGTEGTTWERGLRTVDLLFQALGGGDGRRRAVRQPERLLEYLGHHLRHAGQGEAEVRALETELAHWLTGEARRTLPPCQTPPRAGSEEAEPELPEEWLGQAKLLEPGAWVVFRDEDGLPKPRRLAWTDRRRTRFVFVDEGGRKAEDLDLATLAQAFGDGHASSGSNLDLPATERRWQEMLEGLNRQLVHQATHDDLTGVLNRRTFERRVRHVLERTGGEGEGSAAVCQFSLDDFKLVNNTLGHRGGDELLRRIARRLQEALPPRGVIARVGGDEFAVLLPDQDADTARLFAEEQRQALRAWRPEIDGTPTSVSASVGVLGFSARGHGLEAVLRDVDNACTAAREQGGNRCHVTSAADREAAELRRDAEQVARVDRAVASGELRLSCQRIQPLQPAHRPLHEVLIAAAGEGADAMRPHDFIPAAERYGRMPAVDRQVITAVFAWCARNPGRLEEVDALTINLSGQTLADVDFPGWLGTTLHTYRVPAGKICFELTETAATTHLGRTADLLRVLRDMGCRFALDDFGGGLSSYADLKILPAEFLKIDGAFIRDMDRNAADRNVVQSVHDLAHHMGKLTIAGFVESEEVLEQARELGLDYVQGYHVEHPCPLDELGLQRLDLPV
ncbi:DUF1631 family protein [Aquisalimonas lutea]|uniref:DUF1631 family protein n=1 Tax=Aquisalimonas lutea TaxID=1327750 RepID=UPI0025B5D4D7|nr:DUF1631 family protein [Aquisalimonas lutea]MDN3517141.1 DUF1631 family protein [Aquisalimonas lutea]